MQDYQKVRLLGCDTGGHFVWKYQRLTPTTQPRYGEYLPKRFLQTPRLGTVNLHPSLLPRWRGLFLVVDGNVEMIFTRMASLAGLAAEWDSCSNVRDVMRKHGCLFLKEAGQAEVRANIACAQINYDVLKPLVERLEESPGVLGMHALPDLKKQNLEIGEDPSDLGTEENDDPEEVVDSDDQGGEEADEDDTNDSEEPEPAIHDGDRPTGPGLFDDEQPDDIFGDPLESPKVAEVDDSMGEFNIEPSDSQVPSMDEPILEEDDEQVPTDSQLPEESDLHGLTQPDPEVPEVLCVEESPEKDSQTLFNQRREIEDKISELTAKLNNARKQSDEGETQPLHSKEMDLLANEFKNMSTEPDKGLVLRRSQLALKAPENDEDKGERKKGPGRPKAKAKSKSKAKAKAKSKVCKKVADNKGGDKDGGHDATASTSDIGKGDVKDATPEDGEVRQDPSAGTDSSESKPSEKAAKRKKINKDPEMSDGKPIKKIKQGKVQKPKKTDVIETNNTKDTEKTETPEKPETENTDKPKEEPPQKRPRGQAATFARRPEPTTEYGRAKWSALRDAFNSIIKPRLTHYSAHEDSLMIWVWVWD
eukprot:s967_g12.t1